MAWSLHFIDQQAHTYNTRYNKTSTDNEKHPF